MFIAGLLLFAGLGWRAEGGEVRPAAFLHALQDQGYGDVAVDYLKMLKERGELGEELAQNWDLEMSKSLRVASEGAYNAEDRQSLLAEAEKHLSKFLRERPNDPKAFEARAIWANFAMDKALKSLRAGRNSTDKKQQAKLLEEARDALGDARVRLKEAVEKTQAELESMSQGGKRPPKRLDKEALARQDGLREKLSNYRFQNALVDYYLAQTYAPESDKRRGALETAAKGFDEVFQANRMRTAGLFAHMWHGKTCEELGDWETALDIYDEVLVNAPEGGAQAADPALQALFAQVEHLRFQLLAQRSPLKFMEEAAAWVQENRNTRVSQTEGYQAVVLDLAKAKLDASETAFGAERGKLVAGAMALLAEIARTRGPHQEEAILLRKKYIQSSGKGGEPGSFEESAALGDAAAVSGQWADAEANYAGALKLADNEKIADERRAQVRDALVSAIYMQAREQFVKGKWEESLAGADKILKQYKESPGAASAGSLAVSAALNLYSAAPQDKKKAALERLKQYAKLTEEAWPGKPEADDARMLLAQADLVQGKIDDALAAFEKIDPRSERYPNALVLAAETYWRRWLVESEKKEDKRNKPRMEADLQKALERLGTSLRLQQRKMEPGAPLSRTFIEAQLLLAEIKLNTGQWQEAAALLDPLLAAVRGTKPEEVDNVVARIYLGSIRAYMAEDNLEKAVEAAMLLAESGPDAENVNGALVEVVKMLNDKRKQADAALVEAKNRANSGTEQEAEDRLKTIGELMNKLLVKMSLRKEFSIIAAVYYGDACLAAGLPDVARTTYLRVASRAENDPAYAKSAGKALAWVRTRLVELLAKTGDYAEAYKQVKHLVAANPRALDLLMMQGRILLSWSESDPARYKEAVEHWAKLRNLLQGMAKKPAEYYEATYNLAAALYGQAGQISDKTQAAEKMKLAEQVLKSTLIISPKLSGPEMVDKYNALMKKIDAQQQRGR